MYVFGGSTPTSEASNTFYVYSVSANTWSKVSVASSSVPSMRSRHAITSISNGFVILGGVDSNDSPLNDVWRFETTSNAWANLDEVAPQTAPGAYLTASMASSSLGVVVVGGEISGTPSQSASALSIGTTVYVSTSGSDKNAGTQSSPFLTIRQAVSSVLFGNVVISAGTYSGYGNLLVDPQTAVSISSSGAVTIDCAGTSSAFTVGGNSAPLSFNSITIQGCTKNAVTIQNS
eukprot:TRINITY_DN489_c0_g1_i2.p1 TRINITY_DN489_c0_g1~~TRINITY_DN489_c0_g1_i2.p1  ORF type:complete len:233 (+),score=66.50 TRINITY_DN489_c0_g1_i2:611-1309(+)